MMKCPHCHNGWQLKHSRFVGDYQVQCEKCNGTGKLNYSFSRIAFGLLYLAIMALVGFNLARYFFT